jgi:phosphoribosylformylglycinamidine synthase
MPTAHIHITLKPGLFDAQGTTVRRALHQLGHDTVQDVHIGKYIALALDDTLPADQLQQRLDQMCQQLLANPVIENYEIAFSDSPQRAATPPPPPVRGAARPSLPNPLVTDAKGGAGVSEPFALDYASYHVLPTEEKLSLRSMAWQKHGVWIMQQLNEHEADWVICVGGEVLDSGATLATYPNEERLTKLGETNDLVPWVFTRPPT